MERADVYDLIDGERDYQDDKWGTVKENPHDVGAWLTLMRYLSAKADEAWSTTSHADNALEQVRKLAGVCVACLEQHGAAPRKPLNRSKKASTKKKAAAAGKRASSSPKAQQRALADDVKAALDRSQQIIKARDEELSRRGKAIRNILSDHMKTDVPASGMRIRVTSSKVVNLPDNSRRRR